MDPELAEAATRMPRLSFAAADLDATRATFDGLLAAMPVPDLGDLEVETVTDGQLELRILGPSDGGTDRPAVLDIHGGAFVLGAPAMDDRVNAEIVRATGSVVVSVGYRLAPEYPYPAGLDDCCDALRWLAENAGALDADASRIAVLGSSAGGCLAAAVALRARDEGGPPLAMQVLLGPVLDDRLDSDSMRTVGRDSVNLTRANAGDAWQRYLGDRTPDPYAAPARATDLAGLPPTYISVGELDPLRDEGIDYARRLLAAGVPTELHCWPQAFHGFSMVPGAAIARRASAEMLAALRAGLSIPGRGTA